MNLENDRLEEDRLRKQPWRKWGPYVSERQWGTVREDYSANGDAWNYITHDAARSRAYRWGEDGLAGFCDDQQHLCLGLALWNGRDPILKERLFGLNNSEGNHGEDVKELYYYLDAVPTHSYLKMLYKYPHGEFPYARLIEENARRGKQELEFELIDTGLFDENRYFDVFVEYAKAGPEDLLMRITVHNRGPEPARLHLLPQIWFRNTWAWQANALRPTLVAVGDDPIAVSIRCWANIGCIWKISPNYSSATTKPMSAACSEIRRHAVSSRMPFTTISFTANMARSILIGPAPKRRPTMTSRCPRENPCVFACV